MNYAFTMSILPVQDELKSDKHMNLNFAEFKEAIARIAEIISLIPYGQKDHQFWSEVRRIEQPLIVKLRNLIQYMIYYEKDSKIREMQNEGRDKNLTYHPSPATAKRLDRIFQRNTRQQNQDDKIFLETLTEQRDSWGW